MQQKEQDYQKTKTKKIIVKLYKIQRNSLKYYLELQNKQEIQLQNY